MLPEMDLEDQNTDWSKLRVFSNETPTSVACHPPEYARRHHGAAPGNARSRQRNGRVHGFHDQPVAHRVRPRAAGARGAWSQADPQDWHLLALRPRQDRSAVGSRPAIRTHSCPLTRTGQDPAGRRAETSEHNSGVSRHFTPLECTRPASPWFAALDRNTLGARIDRDERSRR